MPFGVVFAAVVFAFVGVWTATRVPALPAGAARYSGIAVVVLALLEALSLLLRQRWARWLGIVLAAALAGLGAFMVVRKGLVRDFVLFGAFLMTVVLLAVPVTGNARRRLPPGEVPFRRTGRILLALALLALAVIVAINASDWLIAPAGTRRPAPDGGPSGSAAPAPSVPSRAEGIAWLDFGKGIDAGRVAKKPVLVEFYTNWCGVCRAMDRRTFHDPTVVRALGQCVAVRVDAEETRPRGGHRGVDLAERFGVEVYPTLVLLSPAGKEVGRRTGFLSPRELLAWVEPHMGRGREGLVAETR